MTIEPRYLVANNKKHDIIFGETPITEFDDSTTANVVYFCWNIPDTEDKEPIVKVDSTANTITSVAYDEWANRATATYSKLVKGQ